MEHTNPPDLFEPFMLGDLELKNRIVMAPMTRSRADAQGVPSELMSTYYAQRASAGLIVTEGTQPSPGGQGYARTPGLHSEAQVAAWRRVTEAVHSAGGRIFVQLMHAGRIAHRLNRLTEALPVAPSAVCPEGLIYTDQAGPQPYATPHALTREELRAVLWEYHDAARNALRAGFDGVELHAASGYLPMQFLSTNANLRSDDYGGSPENHARFVLEALASIVVGFGSPGRVGLRLGPGIGLNDVREDRAEATYRHLARALVRMRPAYVHVIRSEARFGPRGEDPLTFLRREFRGTVIAAGGLWRDPARAILQHGQADLVAFGRPFIANPDLVERLRVGAELREPDPATFYTPGAPGLIDYPTLAEGAHAGVGGRA